MKIAVGMMWQESASFSQLPTGRRAFEALAWRAGAAVLESVPDGSELRGLLDICADRGDVELVGTRAGSAWPSGPVEREVYEELREGIVEGVREAALRSGLIDARTRDLGIRGPRRTAEADGVFVYTFYKARAVEPAGE